MRHTDEEIERAALRFEQLVDDLPENVELEDVSELRTIAELSGELAALAVLSGALLLAAVLALRAGEAKAQRTGQLRLF